MPTLLTRTAPMISIIICRSKIFNSLFKLSEQVMKSIPWQVQSNLSVLLALQMHLLEYMFSLQQKSDQSCTSKDFEMQRTSNFKTRWQILRKQDLFLLEVLKVFCYAHPNDVVSTRLSFMDKRLFKEISHVDSPDLRWRAWKFIEYEL